MSDKQTQYLEKQFRRIWKRSAVHELKSIQCFDSAAWCSEAVRYLWLLSEDVPPLDKMPPAFKISTVGAVNVMTLFKLLSAKGVPGDEIKYYSNAILQREIARYPEWVRKLSGWFLFTGFARRMTERFAKQLSSAGPDEYKMDFVPGDKNSFGINITQCAVCRLAGKHDMKDMVPSICSIDAMLSDAFGWGLKRTQTIASGGKHCDFVFNKGKSTDVIV